MSWFVFVARCVLAMVFAVAAVAKLPQPAALRDTLLEFGLPRSAAEVGSRTLPLVELAVAALLLPTATARGAAVLALALLVAFCVAIGRTLARGERPDCGCLGTLRPEPVGAGTLVRNGVLAGLAAVVAVAGPGRSLANGFSGVHLTALAVIATVVGVVLVVQSWFLWQLFRQNGRLIGRVRALEERSAQRPAQGLPVGAQAPRLDLPERGALHDLLADGRPVALVFSSPGCRSCTNLLPELQRLRAERQTEVEVVLVEQNRAALEAYRVVSMPSAVVVGPDGRVASATAVGATAVRELLHAGRHRRSGLLHVVSG